MKINGETFFDLARVMAIAASPDRTRENLHAVRFERRGAYLICVATDGRMLAEYTVEPHNWETRDVADGFGLTVPLPTIATAIRALKGEAKRTRATIQATIAPDTLTIGATAIAYRAIGSFPPWEQVIPKGDPEGVAMFGLSAALMRRACEMFETLDPKNGSFSLSLMGGTCEPILCKGRSVATDRLRVVLMPFDIGCTPRHRQKDKPVRAA